MKKGLWLIIFVIALNSAKAEEITDTISAATAIDTTTFVYGNVMYENNSYATAIRVYQNLIDQNGPSDEIYYNLGNCYYKTNEIGKAILNYERALYLNPGNEDAEYNLELSYRRIRDEIDPIPQSIFVLWWSYFIHVFTAHVWSFIAIASVWIALFGFALYRINRFKKYQRPGFFVFVFGLFIGLICLIGAIGRNTYDRDFQFAIVMSPSAILKSEPSENSTNLLLIHEGLKIKLLNNDNNWSEVKVPNGDIGWIKSEEITAVDPFTHGKK